MPLPNFVIIGAQKAGTTWLHAMLRQHPEVFMPPGELHFFDKEDNYRRGTSWYRQFFDGERDEKAVGEKTPDYLWTGREGAEGHLPAVHENLHQVLPSARLIAVLRNPVNRAVSAVNHLVRSGRLPPWSNVDELLVGSQRHRVEPHGVIDYGRYHRHLQAYLDLFDREQLLVLIFEEDVVANPEEGLRKATEFLGVDSAFSFRGLRERRNPSSVSKAGLYLRYYAPFLRPAVRLVERAASVDSYKLHPRQETIDRLYDIYREENERLYELLGRRIPSWQPDDKAAAGRR